MYKVKTSTGWKGTLVAISMAGVLAVMGGCSSSTDNQAAETTEAASSSAATESTTDEASEAATTNEATAPTTQSSFGTMDDFTTETISGAAFTTQDLAANKLTMVNVWTTTCPYCIDEMPGLQLLSTQLPEGVGLIGICADGTYNKATAQSIVQQTGVKFTTLVDSESLYTDLLQNIDGVPTTVFVDSAGNLVGEAQVGVPTLGTEQEIADAYLKLIDEHLALLG